jgi:hypothetical protein
MSPREQRPTSEALTENPAGASMDSLDAGTDSPQEARQAARFDSRRMLARRKIVRELDEYFGVFAYPDLSIVYAVAPSREAAQGE